MSRDVSFHRDRISVFTDAQRRLSEGEITEKEFKGISGGFGSYNERGGRTGMIRLRMCGGHMDRDKLDFIIDAAERYSIPLIHTTTCETVQLHRLTPEQIATVMTEALDHGINTQGGGGDHPRNVSATSLSGVDPGEYFDVYPYAKATEAMLLDIMTEFRLPRKLKVTFSSSPSNETHATFRDMGFVARPDGLFDVWIAGGLGKGPSMGFRVAEAVEPSHVLYHVRAMMEVFSENGDFGDRGHARTRHMKEDLGEARLSELYNGRVAELESRGGLDLHPEPVAFPEKAYMEVSGERIRPQKQKGLYYVTYRPVAGDVELEVLKRIRDAIRDMEGVELRISPDSAIHVVNLSGEEALLVESVTGGGAATPFEASVSCIGGTVCTTGVRDSNGLLKRMISAVRDSGIPADALPRFRISGCPSSCGAHQVGVVGLQGGVRTVDGVPVPVFNMTVNGCGLQGTERFGFPVGAIPEDRVPDMVVFLGRTVADSGMGFDEWFTLNRDRMTEVLADHLV